LFLDSVACAGTYIIRLVPILIRCSPVTHRTRRGLPRTTDKVNLFNSTLLEENKLKHCARAMRDSQGAKRDSQALRFNILLGPQLGRNNLQY
jgi:hypothetical protein